MFTKMLLCFFKIILWYVCEIVQFVQMICIVCTQNPLFTMYNAAASTFWYACWCDHAKSLMTLQDRLHIMSLKPCSVTKLHFKSCQGRHLQQLYVLPPTNPWSKQLFPHAIQCPPPSRHHSYQHPTMIRKPSYCSTPCFDSWPRFVHDTALRCLITMV